MQNHAKIDSGLPALVVALCSKSSNVQIQIGCHAEGDDSLSQLFECRLYHSVRNL